MGQPATIVNPEKVHVLQYEMPDSYQGHISSPDDAKIKISNCFGEASKFAPGPQGFIVDAPASTDVAAHWHPVNQFQVYAGAPGVWYQRREVSADLLHYTDAYSTYGPFGSHGPGRLAYYTMRARASDLTGWMPDDRDKMLRRGRRNYLVPLAPSAGSGGGWETVVEPEEDGLAAYRARLAAGEGLDDPPDLPDAAVGRFYCVLSGSLWRGGEQYPERSMLWQDRRQELPELVADPTWGCDVVAVQFPPELDDRE